MEGRPNRAVVSTSDLNGHLHQQSDFESFKSKKNETQKKRENVKRKAATLATGAFSNILNVSVRIKEKHTPCSYLLLKVRSEVRGHQWLLVSSHQECCGHSPYHGHKICNIADQAKPKSNILSSTCPTVLLFFFCQLEMSLGSGSPLVFNSTVGGVLQPIMTPLVLLSPLAACTQCQWPFCFSSNPV